MLISNDILLFSKAFNYSFFHNFKIIPQKHYYIIYIVLWNLYLPQLNGINLESLTYWGDLSYCVEKLFVNGGITGTISGDDIDDVIIE